MNTLLAIGFWICLIGLFHTYAAYPLLVKFLARSKKYDPPVVANEQLPMIVGLMAVYNEQDVLRDTLASIVAIDYPRDRFQLFIGSDNSTDGTHEIIESFQKCHPQIHLRVFDTRHGKISMLNTLVAQDCAELLAKKDTIIISCDANVIWSEQLPKRLARHFRNPNVGQVATNVVDIRRQRPGIGDQEQTYINGENAVKDAEGRLWGRTMGAFGACFAIRGHLFADVPKEFKCDDFTHSLNVLREGYEIITDPEAICYETVSEKISEEFQRKKRISVGNFQNMNLFRDFLLPWKLEPITSFAFWSHKGLRWFGPLLLIGALLSSALLAPNSVFFLAALLGQLTIYYAAVVDWMNERSGRKSHKLLRFMRYFLLMNLGLFVGMLSYFFVNQGDLWQPTQRVINPEPSR